MQSIPVQSAKYSVPSVPRHQLGWISSKIFSGKWFLLIIFSFIFSSCHQSVFLFWAIRRVHDFLRRNFNTHIAENLTLDGDLLIRWHGIGGRTVSKTRESSYKMMFSRPTQTTFSRLFPLFPLSSVIKNFLFNFCCYFCTKIPIFIFFFFNLKQKLIRKVMPH